MARRGIGTYLHAPCQPVVDMMPVVGSYIAGIDANVLDRIDQRKDLDEHHNHGELPAHTVPNSALDAAVQRRIREGMEPWKAFETGCADVGGRVEEEGPESLCRRR